MRLFASQFASVYGDTEHARNVLGRLEDLQARLVTIDGDLRRIVAFVQSPFLQAESMAHALAQIVEKFMERSDVEPVVELRGEFDNLTDSQQITLLGLIREALSNIREHSYAKHVRISVAADQNGVKASVTDDGRGFDPETTLVRAARGGHLGLVGMHERVRMLGGSTQIDSRPGGPTVISVSLPPHPGREGREAPAQPAPRRAKSGSGS
jgi:signal transduction histidine kinase